MQLRAGVEVGPELVVGDHGPVDGGIGPFIEIGRAERHVALDVVQAGDALGRVGKERGGNARDEQKTEEEGERAFHGDPSGGRTSSR